MRLVEVELGPPGSTGVQGLPRVTENVGEWLDCCEASARELLRERGLPDDLGPWHRTEQGEWRKPRHATLEDWVKSPEHFATLDNIVKPMSAPWLAAKMLWQVEFARGALAAGDAAKAGLDCARLAMWADYLDTELSGHREAAEVGDAVARNGRDSHQEEQRLHAEWARMDSELAASEPGLSFNARARKIAGAIGRSHHTVRSALLRRQKKLCPSPG